MKGVTRTFWAPLCSFGASGETWSTINSNRACHSNRFDCSLLLVLLLHLLKNIICAIPESHFHRSYLQQSKSQKSLLNLPLYSMMARKRCRKEQMAYWNIGYWVDKEARWQWPNLRAPLRTWKAFSTVPNNFNWKLTTNKQDSSRNDNIAFYKENMKEKAVVQNLAYNRELYRNIKQTNHRISIE